MAAMEAALPATAAWKDLHFSRHYAVLGCSTEQALCELVANAIDANNKFAALNKVPSELPQLRIDGNAIEVLDRGSGLQLSAFNFGRSSPATGTSLGQFGVGLKDAVAAFVRANAKVQFSSQHGTFEFCERIGDLGGEDSTIHVRHTPPAVGAVPAGPGTAVRVATMPSEPNVKSLVEGVRASFLALRSPAPEPIVVMAGTEVGTISVYDQFAPAAPNVKYVYINGVKKQCGTALRLVYNIATPPIVPAGAPSALLFGPDQRITSMGDILAAITAGIERLPLGSRELGELRKRALATTKPSCEFAHFSTPASALDWALGTVAWWHPVAARGPPHRSHTKHVAHQRVEPGPRPPVP
jgi:hypothetical protein